MLYVCRYEVLSEGRRNMSVASNMADLVMNLGAVLQSRRPFVHNMN